MIDLNSETGSCSVYFKDIGGTRDGLKGPLQPLFQADPLNQLRFLLNCHLRVFRFDDDKVLRVWGAANGDTTKFVAHVKKTIRWRVNYHFLSQSDLQTWEHLVFWHKHDALGRPTLIIRLGLAFSTLAPSERSLFIQAIGMSPIPANILVQCHGDEYSFRYSFCG